MNNKEDGDNFKPDVKDDKSGSYKEEAEVKPGTKQRKLSPAELSAQILSLEDLNNWGLTCDDLLELIVKDKHGQQVLFCDTSESCYLSYFC